MLDNMSSVAVGSDLAVCRYCKRPFVPRIHAQVTCGAKLCIEERRRERCKTWYAANKAHHKAKVMASRRQRRPERARALAYLRMALWGATADELQRRAWCSYATIDALCAEGAIVSEIGRVTGATIYRLPVDPAPRSPAPAPAPVDIWEEPPPAYPTHLPGVALPLRVVTPSGTELQVRHEHVRVLHALVTRLLGPHSGTGPDFSMLCTSAAPSGWGLYVPDEEQGRALAGRSVAGHLFGAPVQLAVIGRLAKLRAPSARAGRSVVRVDALTPVVTRSDGGPARERPSASSLWNAITASLPARLGVAIDRSRVKLWLLAAHTEPASVDLGGKIAGGGVVRGWIGDVVLEVSPLARWLLECASRIGLGGRTAFGFGRVVVTEMPEPPAESPLPPDRGDLIAPGVIERAGAVWGVGPDAAAERLTAAMGAATFLSGADGGAEIWEADGLRLVCVPWLGDQVRVVDVLKGES